MPATPYRAINWTPNELVAEDKMDQLANNVQWLHDNTPRALYTLPSGLRRVEGVRIAGGRVMIHKRKSDTASVAVRFGNFFSNNCEPIITTGIVTQGQRKIFCVINGIGQLQPDHRGFEAHVEIAADAKKNDKIARSFFVTWQALGY